MVKTIKDQGQSKKLTPLGRATEQTKGSWGAFREEGGSVTRWGVIP